MMARIRDAEHTQAVAELTQKISLLELKVSFILFLFLYMEVKYSKIFKFWIHSKFLNL